MKLYFGSVTNTATTWMILSLMGFIGYSVWNQDAIHYWGRRTLFLLAYGLLICCFAAARDGFDKTVQAAIDGSCAPGLFSLVSIPAIAGYVGAAAILVAAVATVFTRSQHMRELWFYVMSGGVMLKIAVVEIARITGLKTDSCRGNEQCEKSKQSAIGSLLINRRIDLTFHSATARMSEGKAGANGALRVEFSIFPWFTWGFAQTRETAFLGEFTSNSTVESSAQAKETSFLGGVYLKLYLGSSAQAGETAFLGEFTSSSTWEAPHKPGKVLSQGSLPQALPVRAPRKLRDKPNPSSHGHWCCVSGSGPARLLIASRPNAPLRGLNVGLCGDR